MSGVRGVAHVGPEVARHSRRAGRLDARAVTGDDDLVHFPPDLVPDQESLLGRSRPTRHAVRRHTRRLPPKGVKEDPGRLELDLDDERAEPADRIIEVKPHLRRNPRKKPQGEEPDGNPG